MIGHRRFTRRKGARARAGFARFLLPALFAALLVPMGAVPPVCGQEQIQIAAVVNDEAVSVYDLAARIDVAVVASRLQDSPELRRQIAPQVLRSLIQERLQTQEAKRRAVTVSDEEMATAMRGVEERNGIAPGALDRFLEAQGLDPSTVEEQVRAELLWSKLVQRRLRARASVGEGEIDEAIARLERNRGRPEYRVAEIFLAVDSPDEEETVRAVAERLHEQLAGGAPFGPMARQFSHSATAAVGGDIGWVTEGQLPAELDAVLAAMPPGTISRPVRGFDGFYILSLANRRTVLSTFSGDDTVALAQLVVEPAESEALRASGALAELATSLDGCDALHARAGEMDSALATDLGTLKMGDLAADLWAMVDALPIGRASAPLPYQGGVRFLMVCARDAEASTVSPDREAVRNAIAGRRMEMLARRYLRDLRRSAFVDIRI